MIAILTTHNGNVYKSNELVAVTEKEGYYLLIEKYDDDNIPVAEMVINRNQVKTLKTINGNSDGKTRSVQGTLFAPKSTCEKVRTGFRH